MYILHLISYGCRLSRQILKQYDYQAILMLNIILNKSLTNFNSIQNRWFYKLSLFLFLSVSEKRIYGKEKSITHSKTLLFFVLLIFL